MINFSPENNMRIHDMFVEEHKNNMQQITDTVALVQLFNTYHVNHPVLGKSFAYWEFLHACVDNIATNQWRTLPRMWVEYCCASRDTTLIPYQVTAEYNRYLTHRQAVLSKINLPVESYRDKEVLLHWVQNKRSEQYMLGVAHALLRIYLYFTEAEFAGINNNASTPANSFDNADQAIPPLTGDNSQEVLAYSFNKPYAMHDKMV